MENVLKGVLLSSVLVFGLSACGGSGSDSGTQDPVQVQNSSPVSSAGSDQNIATGSVVILNGAASSDADGDTLTYQWSLTSVPSGSVAALSNPTGTSPTFTADIAGSYVAQLIVNDGTENSPPDTVTIVASTANSAPIADAGTDQNIATGSVVTLNGAVSSDVDGDMLAYQWSLTSVPSGSAAVLSNATGASPTFTADIAGAYVAQLIVNDGTENSAPDTVTIVASTANSAPIADAGTDQNIATGSVVTLNGVASSDVDSDTLTYQWSLTSVPSGSVAVLSNVAGASPTFMADMAGSYIAQLIVNDGTENSAPDTVTIAVSTANSAPIANAGTDQNIATGSVVTLNGAVSSDVDGDMLAYQWSLTSVPSGSAAVLSNATGASPTFTADIAGAYVAQLIVNDGTENSAPDTVTILASTANSAPVATAGTDQNVVSSTIVNLDGGASSDADGDGLSYAWTFISKPTGSTAIFDNSEAVNPSFTVDIEGSYVISLVVNDGLESSTPDIVHIEVIQPRVKLYRESGGIFGGTFNEVSLPYSSSSTVNASVTGIPAPTTYSLDTFKLLAQGQNFTITNLSATDVNSQVLPSIAFISDGDELPDGVEVEFELISPLTGGATANINFTFEIQETGETFSASYVFRSN